MRVVLGVLMLVSTSGCAAIFGTKEKDFGLTSDPAGAEVYLNGNRIGTTPVRIRLSNLSTHVFVFKRAGYQDATCTLNRGTDAGWVILDVLSGLVPVVIDAATNNWSQTKGEECSQKLEPLSTRVAARSPAPRVQRPVAEAPESIGPPTLLDDVPTGTRWVADARTRTYYQVGCPITASIPVGQRLYYGNESTLQQVGYTRSEQCDDDSPLPENSDTTASGDAEPQASGVPTSPPVTSDTLIQVPDARTLNQRMDRDTITTANRQARKGFWLNLGLGYGSLGCRDCDGREGSFSGGLALGGAVSQKVTLGLGSNGWYKSENGVSLTSGTLTAQIRFYPSATGGFFLLAGLGAGSVRVAVSGFGSETETGFGALLGLGYDIRVGTNVSITPFWNGFGVETSNTDANVGQIGLGLTVH
jgi:hypothetical protein